MTSGIHYLTCGEAGAGKGIHNSRDFPRETNWRRGAYTYARRARRRCIIRVVLLLLLLLLLLYIRTRNNNIKRDALLF